MKTNKVRRTGHWSVLAVLALVILVLVGVGVLLGYEKLRDLWREQCVIRDMEHQVVIQSGKMVKADVIAALFGLKVGANLATIDFAEKRRTTLEKVPNLRDLRIRRFLPDRVTIAIEEREPIARLNIQGRKGDSGKVVDSEGVVFCCSRGTQLLPVIREAGPQGTAVGHHLTARSRAALRLVEACREPDYTELGLLDADTTKTDYLSATIGGSSRQAQLKIAWEGMDKPSTPASRASLNRQLKHLRDAIRAQLIQGSAVWNATDYQSSPGRIYADTKGDL